MIETLHPQPGYTLSGKIIYGSGIGKLVGMPTANLQTPPTVPLPPVGVYSTRILLEGKNYYGVTNIGPHPTVDSSQEISVETHIMNFNENLYGKTMTIQLYKRLRDIGKYANFSLLLAQIRLDCEAAAKFFGIKAAVTELHMDVKKHRVCIGGREVYLSNKEFDVLYMLYTNPDTAFTKEQIYAAVWHEPPNGFCHAVENTVFQIRKKCRGISQGHEFIKTVVGYGYRFHVM